jgi:hypothetical protein
MRKFLIAALLLAPVAVSSGCAQSEDIDAGEYVDGERKLTDHGAFTVVLSNEDGAALVGSNTFYLDVQFPDPSNPRAEGKGIPGAKISLDAHMPNGDYVMDVVPEVHYMGEGQYMFDGVVLDQPGVWQLDFEIAVGKTVRETVTYTFEVE